MLRRLMMLFLLVASSNTSAQSPAPEAKQKSCRSHPQLIGRCFNVHGRLSVYSGNPALRIWKIGTRRILGISDQRFAAEGYRNVPDYIETKINQDVDVVGDYLVCPFTRSKPGEMQLVCIESGKNLVVRQRN